MAAAMPDHRKRHLGVSIVNPLSVGDRFGEWEERISFALHQKGRRGDL